MPRHSVQSPKVKAIKQDEAVSRVIDEESLLTMAMAAFAKATLTNAVDRICSSMEGAQRWGTEESFAQAGLTKVSIPRTRIRCDGKEVAIPELKNLQRRGEFAESVKRAVLGGLATRQFERVGEALGSTKGLSKSTVSRVTKSFVGDFEKLMKGDCADIVAVWIDAVHFTDEICVIAALGMSRFGGKRLLSLWAGTTESKEVIGSMLDELKDRNLNPKLFIVDGAKALSAALHAKYEWVAIQRCQVHKKRNILEHVGEKNIPWAQTAMTEIFSAETFELAMELGKRFEKRLEQINETAARSWREAFPEVITVLKIKDRDLRKTLGSTNAVESLFSSVRLITGRVKRWRNANHALYWTASGFFRIAPQMHKARGYRAINELDGLVSCEQEAKRSAA